MTAAITHYRFVLFCGLAGWVLYFAFLEGRRGCSLGKLICRLRVIGVDRNPPGFLKAGLRALLVFLIPSSLIWIVSLRDPVEFTTNSADPVNLAVGLSYYAILATLFLTARRCNGLASLVDLATKTRVVRRMRLQERPLPEGGDVSGETVAIPEAGEKLGPYCILEVVEELGDSRWLIGYDGRLLRKVWLRVVSSGADPVSQELGQLSRVGRLRWIAGRREGKENWDAYEYPGGESFLALTERQGASWESARYWLLDLAREIASAEAEDRVPVLSLSRIWITEKGRAKLLDFPVPGHSREEETICESSGELLRAVLEKAERPLPLYAGALEGVFSEPGPASRYAEAVLSVLNRFTRVSRARRAAMLAGCMAIPLLATVMLMFGVKMMVDFQENQPELMSLNSLLSFRDAVHSPWMRGNRDIPDDRLFKIYIAEHFRDTIEDPGKWNTPTAMMSIPGKKRIFAEQSLSGSLNPSEEEIRRATEVLDPVVKNAAFDMTGHRWFPIAAGIGQGFFCVGIPALVAALIFRRGLIMLICGVIVARPDGTPASRGRAFWRSVVTWSPLPGITHPDGLPVAGDRNDGGLYHQRAVAVRLDRGFDFASGPEPAGSHCGDLSFAAVVANG